MGDAISFALTEDEDKDEGCSGYGKYDSPHPVSPSPVWTIENGTADDTTDIKTWNRSDGFRNSAPKPTIEEGCRVGDEYIEQGSEAHISDCKKYPSGLGVQV